MVILSISKYNPSNFQNSVTIIIIIILLRTCTLHCILVIFNLTRDGQLIDKEPILSGIELGFKIFLLL